MSNAKDGHVSKVQQLFVFCLHFDISRIYMLTIKVHECYIGTGFNVVPRGRQQSAIAYRNLFNYVDAKNGFTCWVSNKWNLTRRSTVNTNDPTDILSHIGRQHTRRYSHMNQ